MYLEEMLSDEADLTVDVVDREVRPSVLRILGGSVDTRPVFAGDSGFSTR